MLTLAELFVPFGTDEIFSPILAVSLSAVIDPLVPSFFENVTKISVAGAPPVFIISKDTLVSFFVFTKTDPGFASRLAAPGIVRSMATSTDTFSSQETTAVPVSLCATSVRAILLTSSVRLPYPPAAIPFSGLLELPPSAWAVPSVATQPSRDISINVTPTFVASATPSLLIILL